MPTPLCIKVLKSTTGPYAAASHQVVCQLSLAGSAEQAVFILRGLSRKTAIKLKKQKKKQEAR